MGELKDWLSRLLELTPVAGTLDHRCLLGAPWRIDYEASPAGVVPYHIVLSGSVTIEESSRRRSHRLEAGDIVLLIDGSAHSLHDGSGARARSLKERPTRNVPITENDGKGAKVDMLCGSFFLPPPHERMLKRHLPTRLTMRPRGAGESASGTTKQVSDLVQLMREEMADGRAGGMAIINALSTAMFALVLRLASEQGNAEDGLHALAGDTRLTPALDAMLNEPGHAWTLVDLAELCHMSRATFVRQFERALKTSAGEFLLDVRMAAAARALKSPGASTAATAAVVGYQSGAAFQRAFKLRMGLTPAQWRKQMQSGEAARR